MKILMTQTVQGSLDGLTVQELQAGVEYDTAATPRGDRLASYHIKQGVAVAVNDAPQPAAPLPEPRAARKAKAPR